MSSAEKARFKREKTGSAKIKYQHKRKKTTKRKMTKITDEMLDVIEKVKGKRNPALWDNRCEQYMRNNKKGTVKKVNYKLNYL